MAKNTDTVNYESIIRRVKDVISARVTTEEDGEIKEVHVLARAGRHPRQIMKDVESALLSSFGSSVSQKKISVAQIQQDLDEELHGARLRLESVSAHTSGTSFEARVRLRYENELVEGTAKGAASPNNKLRLVAEATLAAVAEYFRAEYLFALEDVATLRLGMRDVVVVSLVFISNEGEEPLTGSSLIKNDEREAVSRATLDAVNRQFSWLVRR